MVWDEDRYRTLNQELWREMAVAIEGVVAEQEQDSKGKLSFVGWINAYVPRYRWYDFNLRAADLLQAVADGTLKRLMFWWPPRHGKSELCSRLFPAYFLYLYPDRWVGLCSYGATLAESLSRAARTNFRNCGGEIRWDSKAVHHWETVAGGGMWAAGVGGGILGKGCELAVVDDPVKDALEASSATTQRMHQEWWESTYSTRFNPGAAVVIVMQRWHENDLAGWLLGKELERRRPENWHVVAWEALKEEEVHHEDEEGELANLALAKGVDPARVQRVANYVFPSTVTVEPDWRQPGEALCPQRYDREALLDIQDRMSNYYWSALYQQRPRPREGMLFKGEQFRIVRQEELPRMHVVVRFWDYAATEDEGDFTAGVKLGIGVDGRTYVLHMHRGQWGSATRDAEIYKTARMDGVWTRQGREQEPGASGKDTAQQFLARFAAWMPFTRPATGNKFERADPLVSIAQSQGVLLLEGAWNQMYIDEMVAFGSGSAHDDVVDASAGAYNEAIKIVRLLEFENESAGSFSMKQYAP